MNKVRTATQSRYVKAKRMGVSLVCGCLLIFGALLSFCGCKKVNPNVTLTSMPVSITDCEPDKDPINVHSNDTVVWFPKDNSYVITFEPKNYPGTSNAIPVPPPLPVPKGQQTSESLNLPNNCTRKGCYFEYEISEGGKVCNDPGVHVIPGGP